MLPHTIFRTEALLLALGIGLGASSAHSLASPSPAPHREPAAAAARAEQPRFDERAALEFSQSAIGKTVGGYALTDRAGRRFRLEDYRGKPLLVNFVYTACSHVCPATTAFLARAVGEAERALGPGSFAVLTVGFNPPFDSPQAMADFARRYGVDRANWEFASVSVEDVERLTRDFGFVFFPASGGFDHITQVTIVDAEGRIRRQVYGESFELPFLIEPLRELVTGAPASGFDFKQALERLRILCTVYDPAAGRYRLDYALFAEILAGLTVLGGAFLFLRSAHIRGRSRHRV